MTLEQLSAAATQGTFEALTPDVENNFGVPIIATDYPGTYGPSNGLVLWATMLPTEIDAKDIARARANAAFIVALVNLYRTGQLVAVQPDDATVERVQEAYATFGQTGHLRTTPPSRECILAMIAAMKGPKP